MRVCEDRSVDVRSVRSVDVRSVRGVLSEGVRSVLSEGVRVSSQLLSWSTAGRPA